MKRSFIKTYPLGIPTVGGHWSYSVFWVVDEQSLGKSKFLPGVDRTYYVGPFFCQPIIPLTVVMTTSNFGFSFERVKAIFDQLLVIIHPGIPTCC